MAPTYLGQLCGICEHFIAETWSVPGIDHQLAGEVEMSSISQASRWSMPRTNYMSAINVHICRSVVPGRAGGYFPGRAAP